MPVETRTVRTAVTSFLLAILVIAVFWPVLGHEFVVIGDDGPRTDGRQPLTRLSHQLDRELYGERPAGHHLTGLLLHVANTLFLFLLLERLTRAPMKSAVVAALFGLHPLHVESVAWVAAREDLLGTLLGLSTIGAYFRYVRTPNAGRYLTVAATLVLGLAATPFVVTVPFTLLLLDYWPLSRFEKDRTAWGPVWEKVPLLMICAAYGLPTLLAQGSARAIDAIGVYVAYLGKMVWPYRLAMPYPHPAGDPSPWKIAASFVFLAAVTWAAVRWRRRMPFLFVGWSWYLVTLLPFVGRIPAGMQPMADRHTYFPLIGIFVAVAWGLPETVRSVDLPDKRRAARLFGRQRLILAAIGWLVIPALMISSSIQVRHWKDSTRLLRHALAVDERNPVAHNALGLILAREGELERAVDHYRRSIELNPRLAETHANLAAALHSLGDLEAARRELELARRLEE